MVLVPPMMTTTTRTTGQPEPVSQCEIFTMFIFRTEIAGNSRTSHGFPSRIKFDKGWWQRNGNGENTFDRVSKLWNRDNHPEGKLAKSRDGMWVCGRGGRPKSWEKVWSEMFNDGEHCFTGTFMRLTSVGLHF